MKKFLKKLLILVGFAFGIIIILSAFFYFQFKPAKNVTWGVSFSPGQASYLGLDPKKVYSQMIEDLHPKEIRLMAYWPEVEKEQGKFDFSIMDWMVAEAEANNSKVLLVVGHKQPRWPECHHPDWYMQLSADQKKQATLNLVEKTVEHFKTLPAIERWQLENEPFFNYGQNCSVISKDLLTSELALVKKLDSRQVVLTDSGEKGSWFGLSRLADVFGSTMYREIYHTRYQRYIKYPFPPSFYRLHAGMTQFFTGQKNFIGVELQAEPWFDTDIFHTNLARQKELMNPEIFNDNVAYASKVGFSKNYLWGVEWWYWLQEKQSDSSMVDVAKEFFNQK